MLNYPAHSLIKLIFSSMGNQIEDQNSDEELSHSPAIALAINLSIDVTTWIRGRRPTVGYISLDRRDQEELAIKCYLLAIDHREAMAALVRFDYRSSAFALVRPIYEAYVYGVWAESCGDKKQMAAIVDRGELPKFDSAVRAIDAAGGTKFHAMKDDLHDGMSGYTHGSLIHLEKWSSPGVIGQNHSDEQTIKLMRFADLFGVLACVGMLRMAGEESDDDRQMVMQMLLRAAPLDAQSLGLARSKTDRNNKRKG
jgi:hypothetical protein